MSQGQRPRREPKKAPGDAQRARQRHLRAQSKIEAITRLHAGETIEVWSRCGFGYPVNWSDKSVSNTAEYRFVKVKVCPREPRRSEAALVICGGHFNIAWCTRQGNKWNCYCNGGTVYLPEKQVLGVVVEWLEGAK